MIESKVLKFLSRKAVCLSNTTIIVGVSGGPDSMALLHFLKKQQKSASFNLVAVCIDHMFRKEQSYEEALFVLDFCKKNNILCEMKQIDVPAYIEKHSVSSQVAARECRYDFYEEVMKKYNGTYLALAHHGDDQIESIVMRLTRGATGAAKAGIPFERPFVAGKIIRPFLCLTKDEIYHYLDVNHVEYRLDPSNEKDVYFRNRMRNHILPILKKENTSVHLSFQRFSEEVQEDESYLVHLTEVALEKILVYEKDDSVTFSINQFTLLPMPLQRRGIQLILNYLYKNRTVSLTHTHLEHFFSLISKTEANQELDFPDGLKIYRAYDNCRLSFKENQLGDYSLLVDTLGEYILPTGHLLRVDYVEQKNDKISEWELYLPYEDETFSFIIRTFQEGDRISLPNLNGTKKVNRIFIDEKIPVTKRKTWPLLLTKDEKVLWVIGLRKTVLAHNSHCDKGYIKINYMKA